MKKLFIFLLTVLMGLGSLTLSAQNTLLVADGSETNSYIPVYGLYTDAFVRAQIIYPASLVGAMDGATITGMQFYMSSIPSDLWGCTFMVRLGTTGSPSFSTEAFQQVSFTTVYTGSMDPASNGTVTVTFTTPFDFSGGNLLVDVSSVNQGNWSSGEFYGITQTGASISGYSYSGVESVTPYHRNFIPKTNFTYTGGSDCLSPNELAISNITNNSAVFSWHPRVAGTHYYAVVPVGVTPFDTVWTAATDTFATLSGLTGGVQYAALARTDCGSEISSTPSVTFYTECDVVNTFPFFEGFENDWIPSTLFGQNNAAPLCWSVFNGGGSVDNNGYTYDYRWKPNTNNTYQVYAGNHSAVCYTDYAAYPHNDWLISPMMNIPDNMQVSFWAQRANTTTSEPDEISIWISDPDITLTAPAIPASDTLGLDTVALPGFTQIFQMEIPQGPFNLYEIPLTGYTGNRYIAFVRRNSPSDGYYLCLDNVSVEEIPICQRPNNQSTDSIGTDYALLSWNSDANNYIVYYKLTDADSFTVIENVTLNVDSQYVLENLIPGQAYQWYVAAVCDDGTVLPATTVVDFQTECVPIASLPYNADFETNNIGAYGTLPACWNRPGYSNYPYVYDYNAHGGSHCLYVYSTSPVIAVLPELDSDISIGGLQLSFWARCYYGTDCVIEVGAMSDPSDATTFTIIDSVPFNSGDYTEYTADLTSYQGTANHVALRITSGEYDSGWGLYPDNIYLDDLILMVHASCPRPENVTVTNMTTTTATLTWTSEENSFMVYYKSPDMTAYVAANDSPVYDTTYMVENLLPGTEYSFYVASICVDETETPSLLVSTSLPCLAIDTLPYFCGFEENLVGEQNAQLPQCWNRGTSNSSYPYVNSYGYYQGSHALYSYYSNTVCMPPIDPDETPYSDLQVSFYAKGYTGSILKVGVMTDPFNPNSFVQVGNDIELTSSYTLYEVAMASYQGTGTRIAFLTPNNTDFYMDNVTLDYLPDCQRPTITNVTFSNIEATVTWTADDNEAWQVVITDNYAEPSTLTPVDVSDNTYTFDNLTPNSLYQIYVRTDCGDQYSDWSNVYSFTTLNAAPASVPYSCDFEDTVETAAWTMVNGFMTNKWFIDTAANNTTDGQYGLYVSSDSGATVSYNISGNNTVWAYRDLSFGDAAEFNLSFDWRCLGETGAYGLYDYLQVLIGTPTAVNAGSYASTPSSLVALGDFAGDSTWSTASVTLDGTLYANTTQRLYFRWYNDYADGSGISAAVDNIVISEVECARPAAIEMTTIGTTTATLTITPASETDAVWEVMLNDSAFSVTDVLVTLSDLTPGSVYEVYVRTVCDGGDTSVWSLPISFITECLLISSVPQTWGFETDLISGSEDYPLMVCWNRINSPSSSYSEYPYVSNYEGHTGTHSMYYYAYYNDAYGILPAIDTDALNLQELELSFYAFQSGSGNITLKVGVMTDPSDASTFTEVQAVTLSNAYPADPYVVSFANYTGNGTYIAIKNHSNGYSSSGIYMDDVTLEEIPDCLPPTGVTASNITETSAEVAWTENGSATSWTLRYYEVGDETNAIEVTTSSNPHTITGLTPGTFYIARVKANCSSTETSTWGTSPAFMTNCVSVTAFPYTEGFEGTDLGCWTSETVSGNNPWVFKSSYAHSGSQSVGMSYTVGTISRLISPVFDFTGLNNPAVSFFYYQPIYSYSGTTDTIAVYYRTSSSAEWVRIEGFQLPTDGFVGDTLMLPNPSATYQIAFLGHGVNGNSLYLDDVKVFGDSSVTVTDPTVVTAPASNVAQTTATLNGTITNPDNVTITAQGFEWKLSTAADYTVVNATGNPMTHNLTGLTENTTYTYRAFITFNGSTVYGSDETFTTLQQGQAQEPSATTLPATNVMQTTATLNGTISNPDNVTITAQGFEWKAASASSYTTVSATGATMASPLTGLTANTAYTYRAFVTTSNGTHYGADVNFTTQEEVVDPCDVPTGLDTTNVANETISITWNANSGVNSWNIQYRPQNGQWATGSSNTNNYTITGLTGNTTYEIQVQANCGNGNLSDWSASLFVTTKNVGIQNWLDNSVMLYPNPAKEYVDIRVDGELNVNTMEVYDVYGKLINTVIVNENPTRINVSNLANGMYFVRVTTEMGAVTKTFVKR
ncbi:MAG: fibronectin type III domain-containing protein [Bacteroidales bacterium]|nr:fibronectin type III domain-containing protein [Bacteroidales bacterium]